MGRRAAVIGAVALGLALTLPIGHGDGPQCKQVLTHDVTIRAHPRTDADVNIQIPKGTAVSLEEVRSGIRDATGGLWSEWKVEIAGSFKWDWGFVADTDRLEVRSGVC